MLRSVLAPAVLVLALVACGGAAGSAAPSNAADPGETPVAGDPGGAWQLVAGSVGGRPLVLPADRPVTFVVDGSQVGGQSGCNQYFGELSVVDGRVAITGLGGTEMGCEAPIMTLEAAYLEGLAGVRVATIRGDTLLLGGDAVELQFERLPPPPTADLVGTEWILDGLVLGDAVASTIGEPATLVLAADGTLAGSTGCRTLSGRYTLSGDRVTITDFEAHGECAGGPADQDAHVVGVLEAGFDATVDGQGLTLTGAGGNGLVYRAAESG